jgi:hypothetical protein
MNGTPVGGLARCADPDIESSAAAMMPQTESLENKFQPHIVYTEIQGTTGQ